MDVDIYISALVQYGLSKGLFEPCDKAFIIKQLLSILQLDSCTPAESVSMPLEVILQGLLADAERRGICDHDSSSRDLLDAKLMGVMTPSPHEVQTRFSALYKENPKLATDWFYKFSQDTNHIRRYRLLKDVRWKTATEYGNLHVVIKRSKSETDFKALTATNIADPMRQRCIENDISIECTNRLEVQNGCKIPITLSDEDWYLQYNPSVYFSEHCVVLRSEHTPMKTNQSIFQRLLDFVTVFPHYFAGSVTSTIDDNVHFDGGCYSFPIEHAPIEKHIQFNGYMDISAGIVKWPMSVIRLNGSDKNRIVELAEKILCCWRESADADVLIASDATETSCHDITSIARHRGEHYELDLVLRSRTITKEGAPNVYHLMSENIGLTGIMGLAVLPARLKDELAALEDAILMDGSLADEVAKYDSWMKELKARYTFTPENISSILKVEIGKLFAHVLEQNGVYKRNKSGKTAFMRFIEYVNLLGRDNISKLL